MGRTPHWQACRYRECTLPVKAKGYCNSHWAQYNRTGKVWPIQNRHNLSATVEHMCWRHMQTRCYNKNSSKYEQYGDRGIKVCDRWLGKSGFINFLTDMGKKPSPKHSIDRIDVNGDYEPTNCRWATSTVQSINKQARSNTGHRGVSYIARDRVFVAQIQTNGVNHVLGRFSKLQDAVERRLQAKDDVVRSMSNG